MSSPRSLTVEEINAALAELAASRQARPENVRVKRALEATITKHEAMLNADQSTQARGK